MTVQDVVICITALISAISLLISVANYRKSKPKLKIAIADRKWDCFFGTAISENHPAISSCICGAYISIVNNSPVAITISEVSMMLGKEKLRLIDNRNSYWDVVRFSFEDKDGEITMDQIGIYYKDSGLKLPYKINAYDTLTASVLFHNFPVQIKRRCKGMIVLTTAIGNIKKRVMMVEYNKDYQDAEYRDYLCYCRSLEKTK
mgnify:CR=1 FL=1